MRLMKVDDRNIQAETSRELLSMFYGLVFAYDEGLKNGDDVLAAAVWRNLFHASKAKVCAHTLLLQVFQPRPCGIGHALAMLLSGRRPAGAGSYVRADPCVTLMTSSLSKASTQDLAVIVEYIRKEVQALDDVDSETVVSKGQSKIPLSNQESARGH